MNGLPLAASLFAVFWAGAYLALLVRALIEDATKRRLKTAAEAALEPEQLARLRAYIATVDEHERESLARTAPAA